MVDSTGATPEASEASRLPGEESRPRRMTICDGEDGMLTLDLRYEDIHWLVDACRRLASDHSPHDSGMLKVSATGTTYLVSVVRNPGKRTAVRIVNLFDPVERVELSDDLIGVIAGLVEEFPHTTGHA
ncbi:MAG TPA: hypothetical protein VKQ30_09755 [Ktedonobacterales bacterium]|nr:hypothetical protein [Ktedonobacterales bacterium]